MQHAAIEVQPRPPAVVFEGVSKHFLHRPALFNLFGRERSGKTFALRDISLSAAAGELLVLLGPNGSGKTTFLKLISTMLLPDAGRVRVHGADTQSNAAVARRAVGFAIANERSFYPRLTARENLAFFACLDDVPRHASRAVVDEALERVGLAPQADTLAMKFSTGMYQKLGIARALLKSPKILLLDEATRSLDPQATRDIWGLLRALRAGGACVISATHNLEEAAEVADKVAIFDRGRVALHVKAGGEDAFAAMRNLYFAAVEVAYGADSSAGARP